MSKKYHLCKQSREYLGTPYKGVTSNNVPTEYSTLQAANKAVIKFTLTNPVGWDIYNSKTGELV